MAGAWSPARGAGPLVLGTISPLYPFHPCIGTFFPTPPSSPRSTTSPRRQPPEAGEGRAPARLWLSVKWGILRQEAAGPPSLLPVPTSSQDSLSPRQGQCPASPPAPLGFYPSHPRGHPTWRCMPPLHAWKARRLLFFQKPSPGLTCRFPSRSLQLAKPPHSLIYPCKHQLSLLLLRIGPDGSGSPSQAVIQGFSFHPESASIPGSRISPVQRPGWPAPGTAPLRPAAQPGRRWPRRTRVLCPPAEPNRA